MTEEEKKDYQEIMEGRAEVDIDQMMETNKRLRGIEREEHFNSGRSLEDWRGITRIQTDKVKEQMRRACRKKVDAEE